MISLIVFLGNIGQEYERTRHNAAWIAADKLNICAGISWQRKFQGQYGKMPLSSTGGQTVHVVKPETYMNLSGNCAGAAAQFFKIAPADILIVHDELELPLSVLSLKWSGGLGGHNGLRSIKAALGTADFWRLRIGIGRPDRKHQMNVQHKPDIAEYVLSPFSVQEYHQLTAAIPAIDELFSLLLTQQKEPDVLLKAGWNKKMPD